MPLPSRPALLALSAFTLVAACGPPRGPSGEQPRLAAELVARWSLVLGATDRAAAAAVAANGAGAVIAGSFEGTLPAGAAELIAAGSADGFVAAVDGTGAVRWAHRFGGSGHDGATAVAAVAGRVAVAGTFEGDAEIFGRAVRARGSREAFVAMLEADGTPAWLVVLDASDEAALTALTPGAGGGVVGVGYVRGAVTVGGRRYASAGSHDALVVSLDAGGAPRFVRRAGGPAADHAHGVAVGPDGAIYVAGGFARQADFGGAVLQSNYHQDGFLAALRADGAVAWVNTFGGTERDVALAVAVLPDGAVAVAGRFESSDASFGGAELSAGSDGAAFLAAYAADGEPRWSARIGNGAAEARSLVVSDGELVVGGSFAGSQRVAGSDLVPVGERDLFVARYAPGGDERGAVGFGSAEHDDLTGLAASPRALVVAGTLTGAARLGAARVESTGASAAFAISMQP